MDNVVKVVLLFSILHPGLTEGNGVFERSKRDNDELGLTIKNYIITSSVVERFSTVNIHSRLQNENLYTVNSTLLVPVPEEAFISNFSILINGVKYVGNIVSNEEVETTTNNGTDAQLDVQVKFTESIKERGINIFEIEITLEAGAQTTFFLTYNELLVRRLGLYTQRIIVNPGQVVDTLAVNAIVLENQGFETFSYAVPHSNKPSSSISNPTVNSVLYQPTNREQLKSSSKGIDGELVISYDLKHEKDTGNIVVEGDYFVHYFTPSGLETISKNILFVIDVSGSMDGTNIGQVQESMLTILDNLNPKDYFNILTFSSHVQKWLPLPAEASSESISKAKKFVQSNLTASGSTNINDALLQSIQLLKLNSANDKRAGIIFFLTDGEPSTGVTDTKEIRQNVKEENNGYAAIYCLGFGFNLDFNFINSLAYENNGFSRQIYEDDNANEQLVTIYNEIKDPLLLNVELKYDSKYVILNSTTTNKFYQYFNGTEIIVAGKLKKFGILPADAVVVQGISKDGKLDLPMKSKSVTIRQVDENNSNKKLRDYKKIKDLVELYSAFNVNEAKQLAIELAIENNFVTQFTSFVLQIKTPSPQRNKVMDAVKFGVIFPIFLLSLFVMMMLALNRT